MDDLQSRAAVSTLRRWCPVAETHQDADDPVCAWDGCLETRATHRLRLRRMFVCARCQQGYFERKEFNAHECFSAY
jgi:hypothetical protein